MYTLHIANKNYSSWSLRPWVLMRELSIPFAEKVTAFSAGSNWKAFKEFCPSGLVPCLIDGGEAVWDSLAIMEYLAEKHSGVWPQQMPARSWARCASAEMHSGFYALRSQCPMNCGLRVKLHSLPDTLQHDIKRIDELMCEGLQRFGGPFLAGDKFTAVDAFYAPVIFRIQTYSLPMSKLAMNYVNTMLSLKSLREWEAMALNEEWREAAHEKEVLEMGVVLEDKRK
ncbi:MAG: glutathione S-transferase family protein [Proteobacteria bacterium]|nr:glutathione S-transferase family protein [Pseudomonadota bacterium]